MQQIYTYSLFIHSYFYDYIHLQLFIITFICGYL